MILEFSYRETAFLLKVNEDNGYTLEAIKRKGKLPRPWVDIEGISVEKHQSEPKNFIRIPGVFTLRSKDKFEEPTKVIIGFQKQRVLNEILNAMKIEPAEFL
jgi:hypothetical protein